MEYIIDLVKAKRGMVGETRIRADGHTYKKQGDGSWVRAPDSVRAHTGDKVQARLKSKGHGAIIESVTTGQQHTLVHKEDGKLYTTSGLHLAEDRYYKILHPGTKKPKDNRYKGHTIKEKLTHSSRYAAYNEKDQFVGRGKTPEEAKARVDQHLKNQKLHDKFREKIQSLPGRVEWWSTSGSLHSAGDYESASGSLGGPLGVKSTQGSIHLDRFRRHDHGGGRDGDDWLDSHEIDKDYEEGRKKHGWMLDNFNEKLKAAGFEPNATFELGEKGHFSIEFDLKKKKKAEKSMDIASICDDLIKSGEGSKGGKVIGHTKSGKPIYADSHKNNAFTSSQDHKDAKEAHLKEANSAGGLTDAGADRKWAHHKNQAKNHDWDSRYRYSYDKSLTELSDLIKAGEGSKGGKIIGHTKSGKPIYDSHSHPGHSGFTKTDHKAAAALHKKNRRSMQQKPLLMQDKAAIAHHRAQEDAHTAAAN